MRFAIFSDDLTGASGVAPMINAEKTITVNYEKLSSIDSERFDNLSINLDMIDSVRYFSYILADSTRDSLFSRDLRSYH